jgi:hypothetical protein
MSFSLGRQSSVAACVWLLDACTNATPSPRNHPHEAADASADERPPVPAEAGAPLPSDASGGVESGGRPLPNVDAGQAVSTNEDLPRRDPDAGVRTGQCGTLRPWAVPASVSSVSVLQGGDGFAGLLADTGFYTGYVFDSRGDAALRIGKVAASSSLTHGLRGASTGGDVTAALVECNYKFSCGSALLIAGERPRTVQPSVPPVSANPHVAVNRRGDIVLASLRVPEDVNAAAIDPNDQFYDLRMLDRTGQLAKTAALPVQDFGLIDMATGDAGTVLLLGRQAGQDANDGIDEVVISLDQNLKQRQILVMAARRAARSIVMNGQGMAIVVGTAVDPSGSRLWLDAFDAVTLKEAWPHEQVGDLGVGLAVDVGSSGEIATLATTGDGDAFVVQKHDSAGVAEPADAALVAKIQGDASPVTFVPGIAFQSDGSIFVSTPVGAFVSCPP